MSESQQDSLPQPDPGSFRDPTSRVLLRGSEVYRVLDHTALDDFRTLAVTRFYQAAQADGRLAHTEPAEVAAVGDGQGWAGALRHERVPFVSYPFEWSFAMLRDAALLQLELLAQALDEDLTTKDATSYNVQWRGSTPVFIDLGSFEPLRPGEPWYGYRQFCELFLYPLLLQAYKNVSFQPWLRGSLDGIPAAEMRNLMALRDYVRKGVFKHVYLHAKLQAAYGDSRRVSDVQGQLRKAGFNKELIKSNVAGLAKLVRGLRWKAAGSEWSDYRRDNSYTDEDTAAKSAFVSAVAATRRRGLVWDLGANDGRFSRIVAPAAECVLAVDSDHLTVDRLYRSLRADGDRRILPLVMDLVDASPGLGWRSAERRSFLDRGRPDLVLCLAVVHHLAITRSVPLPAVTAWLADTTSELVVEFPTREDPQVQRLLHNKRAGLYDGYQLEAFEASLSSRFHLARREVLPSGTRVLYHATRASR